MEHSGEGRRGRAVGVGEVGRQEEDVDAGAATLSGGEGQGGAGGAGSRRLGGGTWIRKRAEERRKRMNREKERSLPSDPASAWIR